ncbi:fungal-specific transcription factor domain-containing protein [Xylaria sp. FL0064]|nr:fungal-specific transcription factor domain-containing protein [Xylaria sp. FL0064]
MTCGKCGSCVSAQAVCVTSTRLRRRTTARGYRPSTSTHVDALKNENADLRRQLEAERAFVALLRSQLQEAVASAASLSASYVASERQEVSTPYNVSTQTKAIPALLIKHMGRLVQDSSGVDRFAGTTTGVHFMLLVQQAVRSKQLFGDFSESSFKLYLLDWVNHKILLSSLESPAPVRPTLMEMFRRPLSYYSDQVVLYASTWSCLCPIIEPADLIPPLPEAMHRAQSMEWPFIRDQDLVLFRVALVVMMNSTLVADDRTDTVSLGELSFCVHAVAAIVPTLMERADMLGLHSLALLSFYILLVGQHQSMPRINGILVQYAFSLGLHRHGRRFKYSAKENEMRKRLWWWIYIFDKMTAISHGLPTLIQDRDVDIDYPLDCDLSQGDPEHVSLPLPGESTPVNDFIALVHLGRILSAILEQLYTTTSRRNGPGKIVKLRNELLGWNQKFVGQLDGQIDSDGLLEPLTGSRHSPGDGLLSRVLLLSLSNMAIMLIHRPGLTFSENTPEFHESFKWCILSSSNIIENAYSVSSDPRMHRIAFTPSPNVIFQSAMLHIYLWCQLPSEDNYSGTTRDLSLDRIKKTAEILSRRPFKSTIDDPWYWRTPEYSSCALHECLSLLQALSTLVICSSSITLPPTPSLWGAQASNGVSQISDQNYGTSDAALYDLNRLDYLDPLFETAITEFSPSIEPYQTTR